MSLDIYLQKTEEVYWGNITHNLGKMASETMLYYPLWRPEEIGIEFAGELVPFLIVGLKLLEDNKEKLIKEHSPANGWGTYEGLLAFTKEYLKACVENPDALIRVSR